MNIWADEVSWDFRIFLTGLTGDSHVRVLIHRQLRRGERMLDYHRSSELWRLEIW